MQRLSRDEKYEDKFQEVLEDYLLDNSSEEIKSALLTLEKKLDALSHGSRDWINLKLGITSLKCRRYKRGYAIDPSRVAVELEALGNLTAGDANLSTKFRIVKAQYLQFLQEQFSDAQQLLEQLAQELKHSKENFLYGIVSKNLFILYTAMNEVYKAEEYAHDCLSILRRFARNPILYARSLGNYGVLKKKLCQYSEAEKLHRGALKIFEDNGSITGEAMSCNNIAIVKMKIGDWTSAKYYFRRAMKHSKELHARFSYSVQLNIGHLQILERKFDKAKRCLQDLLCESNSFLMLRIRSLAMEFLGELYMETGDLKKAEKYLTEAQETAEKIAPESDVMTELKRRLAQLYLHEGDTARAEDEARECIRICLKIRDKHELGAVMRTLAAIHLERGADRKAESAFEAGINILKSINEAYELMRTCLAYGDYLVSRSRSEADIYLLEAKQIASKLALDYFLAGSMMLLGRHAMNDGNLKEAKAYLSKAEEICNELRDPCRKKLESDIRSAARELEKAVLRVDNGSVQKLKALGRIYEEARFPMREVAPEVATEVARSVGSDGLFLAVKKSGRYRFPIKYNISAGEAAAIVRRIDCGNGKRIFGIHSPHIYRINGGKLIGVPGRLDKGYVLCTLLGRDKHITSHELEFLMASAEALERIAEEQPDGNSPGSSAPNKLLPSRNIGKFKDVITRDPAMIKLIGMAERAAKADVPVLLQGETGVGKELFARAIQPRAAAGRGISWR